MVLEIHIILEELALSVEKLKINVSGHVVKLKFRWDIVCNRLESDFWNLVKAST